MSTSRYQKLNNRKRRLQYRLRERLWAPQDQPMFRARNIHYELSDRLRGLAPGGMGAMHHLARRVGLIAAIDRYLHLLKIHLPYHESDHVLNVAYNILAGGTCLEDLELSRNDEVYLDALGAQRIPDPTTEGDFCRRFTAVDVEILQDTLNEVRLGVVNGTIALTRRPATRAANSTIGASASEEAGKLSCAAGYRHSQCIHDRLEEVHRKRANRPSPAFSPVPVRVRSRALEAAGGILDNAAQCQGQVGGLLAMQDSMDTAGSGDDVNYVYAYDGNGSVAHVLDWSASPAPHAIVAKYEYDPYGNVVAQAGDYAERNPFRFSTKYWDDETGLGYWGYRYYSSRMGRWTSRDPAGHLGDLDLYRYCVNRPASVIDAQGMFPVGGSLHIPYELVSCAEDCDKLCASEEVKRLFQESGADGAVICGRCGAKCKCVDPNVKWDTPGKGRERECVLEHEDEHMNQWRVFCLCWTFPCEASSIGERKTECPAYTRQLACLKKKRDESSCDEECKRHLDGSMATIRWYMRHIGCAQIPH